MSRHRILSSLLVFVVAGCNLPDAASPEMIAGARASVSLNAQVVLLAADAINVRVTYSRTSGLATLIDSTVSIHKTETGTVDWVGDRGFPVEIDLAQCLLDPAHIVAGHGCLIGITVRLLQNGAEVDRTTIAPFKVEPGVLTIVPQTIVLREIGTVDIDAPLHLLRVGDAMSLGVKVVDVAGDAVVGRSVAWRSADDRIAHVQADGRVIAVGPGQVTLTARVGIREGSATLTVTPQ